MTNLTVEHFKDSDEADIKWVSLACGAAVPVLDAVDGLRQTDNSKNVHLTLVDYDPEALNFAEYLAGKQGLEADADYSIESANLIRELIVSDAFVQRHGAESYDMVDMLGIFEYFDKEMSAKMLHNAFALVKEGGQLVLGNMLVTHDNLQLNQRAIGWPSIKPRSFEEIAEIIELAGIPVEQSEAYVPKDGVYAVVSIEKSAPAPRPFPSRIAETALRNSR
jgi:cyclopropane fatty-acyl-phospholipid synthase-like methyltransferase